LGWVGGNYKVRRDVGERPIRLPRYLADRLDSEIRDTKLFITKRKKIV